MPKWPPLDYDYSSKLKEHGLRQVEASKWKIEPEEDASGLRKAVEIENFKGYFKDS